MSDEHKEHDWAGPRALRAVTVAAFVPAFPLCIAHGAVSHYPVPATGLVPLAASAGLGGVVLFRRATIDKLKHPAIIFAADLALGTTLMVILVFTWISAPRSRGSLSMLAAYATIPLLLNSLIHIFLALRALHIGLAVDSLAQWAAFRAVPPECPNCNHNLRPSLPALPWFRRGDSEYTRLLANDEETRYRDEEEVPSASAMPEPVQVTKKKGKIASPPAQEPSPW